VFVLDNRHLARRDVGPQQIKAIHASHNDFLLLLTREIANDRLGNVAGLLQRQMIQMHLDKKMKTPKSTKQRYQQYSKAGRRYNDEFNITPGMRGFLVTCDRGRERAVVREMIDVLQHVHCWA
jgi:hypothetical protein